MCLKFISNCFSKNQSNIAKARRVRDDNLTCFENTNMFFTALLALFGVIHLICGAKFINDDLIQNGHGMDRVKRYASVFVGFSCTITIIFALTSYCITKRPQCPMICLPIYGLLLPCLAMPVLFSEGTALYAVSRLDTEEILQFCNIEKKEELIDRSGPIVA